MILEIAELKAEHGQLLNELDECNTYCSNLVDIQRAASRKVQELEREREQSMAHYQAECPPSPSNIEAMARQMAELRTENEKLGLTIVRSVLRKKGPLSCVIPNLIGNPF